jgi:hypothetical protein
MLVVVVAGTFRIGTLGCVGNLLRDQLLVDVWVQRIHQFSYTKGEARSVILSSTKGKGCSEIR